MSTMTGTWRRMLLSGVAGVVIAVGMGAGARADVASDKAGAIIIFPKIVVDTGGVLGAPTDTEVQITNTSNSEVSARCWIVDETWRCSNNTAMACTPELVAAGALAGAGGCPSGGMCQPRWKETGRIVESDFQMTLTKRQPISWRASEGLLNFPLDGITNFGPNGQSNSGSSVPPVQGDPFIGEIRCVEVDANFSPQVGVDPINNFTGDLKGEATIISATPGTVDARKYNAIGLQATTLNDGDEVLELGGDPAVAEYNGCPNILILDHFFDGATVPTHNLASSATVTTDLTLVLCGADFATQAPITVTVQFLVFNEFEQRFSTSIPITNFREVRLANIDTRPTATDDNASIFSVNVEGTLGGQTRIRSVAGANSGNTIIGVAEEFWKCIGPSCAAGPNGVASTAANLHFAGMRSPGDVILMSSPETP